MLSNTKVRAAKPRERSYKLTDANRLFLLVTSSGGKLWRWNYSYDGKQKSMAFGAYPLVALADALCKRDEAYNRVRKYLIASALGLGATGALIMTVAVPSTPAQAIVVFDPSNYSQNVLTAARTLQQINNQKDRSRRSRRPTSFSRSPPSSSSRSKT